MNIYVPQPNDKISVIAKELIKAANQANAITKTIFNGVILVVNSNIEESDSNHEKIRNAYRSRFNHLANGGKALTEWDEPLGLDVKLSIIVPLIVGFFNIIGFITILPWLVIALMSFMAFDAPGSEARWDVWLFVGIVWTYPGWFLATTFFGSQWLMKKRKSLAAILVSALVMLPVGAFLLLQYS